MICTVRCVGEGYSCISKKVSDIKKLSQMAGRLDSYVITQVQQTAHWSMESVGDGLSLHSSFNVSVGWERSQEDVGEEPLHIYEQA